MLSCFCVCSGKFQSPRTEYLSSPPLPYCLLNPLVCFPIFFCSFDFKSSSNLSSHHGGREYYWSSMAFSCDVPSRCIKGGNHGGDVLALVPQTDAVVQMSHLCCLKSTCHTGSLNFSRSNFSLGWFGIFAFFRRTRKVIITRLQESSKSYGY